MIKGNVSLLGTLNFHQSMIAAAIMPAHTTQIGQ
jgi:hypothetical protein